VGNKVWVGKPDLPRVKEVGWRLVVPISPPEDKGQGLRLQLEPEEHSKSKSLLIPWGKGVAGV